MEIEDGAYPLLEDIKISTNYKDAFTDCDIAILIGSYPHRPGMERNELLQKNAEIFKEIGQTLNQYASKNVKVVVVANPVNSLTTILAKHAPKIPAKNFSGLSRLDYNRAKFIIAKKCNVKVDHVKNLIVWGNHSDTQYPDTFHCNVDGKPILEVLTGQEDWLHKDYVELVANRWKQICDNLGGTSVMGPANAIKDHLRDWIVGTKADDMVSMAVMTDGTVYGIPKGVCFSLPFQSKNGEYKIVDNLVLDGFDKNKLEVSYQEIVKELNGIGFKIEA